VASDFTRRQFLASTAAVATAVSVSGGASAKEGTMNGPCICVFSKHLQFLDYDQLADTCKDVGLDGVDLTVREGGHVLPEKVTADLPRAVESIRKRGLEVPMITTRLVDGDDSDARPIFETASKLGIPYARIGGKMYEKTGGIMDQVDAYAESVRGLAKLAEEFGITLGYHNHSGPGNLGAALWDLHRLYEMVGSDLLGSNLDAGHAKVEGAFGAWETNVRLIAPYTKMMAVKDFVWDKDKPRWAPLGEGIVDTTATLKIVREAGFAGPISLHFEYKVPSDDAMIEEVRKAVHVLGDCLKQAGYA
jgi:sugar phosphate isomerase/epimerase